MFDIKIALLLVVAISIFVIGIVIYYKKQHSPESLSFVVLTAGISFWASTNALFQVTSSHTIGFVAALLSYYAGICIALSFYAFAKNFPVPIPEKDQKKLALRLWLYGLVWVAIISLPWVTIKAVLYDPVGRIITGPGLYWHFISIAFFVISGLVILWRKRKKANLISRRQLNIIIIGCLIAGCAGILLNLVLPLFNNYSLVWLGPDFALALVVCMAYAMVKHRLFDFRILTTEIFAALLGLVMVVELLRSQTTLEIIIRSVIIAIYIYLGRQMFKSVYEEIRAKEALHVVNSQLQTVNAELQELIDIKTDFIHAASHQLRTPLTAIRGLLTMEYEGDYDNASVEERKRLQRNVLTSVERLTNVVNDLLRAAELEHGMTGDLAPGDVEVLVQRAIETLRLNYEKKSIQLNYTGPTTSLPHIAMRENYLEQVFLNLLDNAERYSPPNGKVTVSLNQQADTMVFTVSDYGLGFNDEDVTKLFTKFGRTTEAKAAQPNGTGLGLYIAKRIVEQHGGSITAKSDGTNMGATFVVTLPIQLPARTGA